MKLGFNTLSCPDWSLERVAEMARTHGYDGVELRLIDGEVISAESLRANRARIRRLFDGQGPRLLALAASSHLSGDDLERRAGELAAVREVLAVAADLGAPLVRVFGGRRPEGVDRAAGNANVAAGLAALAPDAERLGVTVMLETHDDFCRSADAAAIVALVPSPAVGIHWDIQNTVKLGEPIEETWARIGDRVVHVHVKDARRAPDEWERVLLGEGDVPVRAAVELLHARGYAGALVVEIEKKWHPEYPSPEEAIPRYAEVLRAYLADL